MGYLDFHMMFIVPPVGVLLILVAERSPQTRRRTIETAGLLALLATIWATPWDNYMVAIGAWGYSPATVVATIGYIPVEEQLFFILQPLLTVCFLGLARLGRSGPGLSDGLVTARQTGYVVAASLLGLSAVAALLHVYNYAPYLTAIVAWFTPVAALQVAVGGPWLAARWRLVATAILAPTVYLCIVDAIAIDQKHWTIHTSHTVGIEIANLPLEEAVFFLVTNAIVVGGAVLYLDWYDWIWNGLGFGETGGTGA